MNGDCCIELRVEVSGGPVTNNIEVRFCYGPDIFNMECLEWLAPELSQWVSIDCGQQLEFCINLECNSHAFTKWEFRDDEGNLIRESASCCDTFILLSGNIHATAFLSYTPEHYTISGTVLRDDGVPIPGGVDFTVSSPAPQEFTVHVDGSTFELTGVHGGVPVTVTASATGYLFSHPKLVYANLCENRPNQTFTGYSSDWRAPITKLLSYPPEVSEES